MATEDKKEEAFISQPLMPTAMVLDLGCTRAMASRVAAQDLMKFCDDNPNCGIWYTIAETTSQFTFANSESTKCKQKLIICMYDREYAVQSTEFDIVEQGHVPILMSLPQMRNLRFHFELHPDKALLSSPILGIWDVKLKVAPSSHLVLDLLDLSIDQKLCVSELEEIVIPKHLKDTDACDKSLHTSYRSLLGSINWLQSRTQFQACYQFSRLASASAAPTVGHCKELNKLCRQIRSEEVELRVWPVKGSPRILGIPDAAFRNNSDKSSQRAMTIFIADERVKNRRDTRGSLVFFESTKIKRTTLSATVAELYALMKCFGTCQMLRGLWKDISGLDAEIHMRTDANNLVSTASTTHSPEQQETIHMIQMLRKEACSGAIADLSHVRTEHCLSDCLTKRSANPRNLLNSVQTGWLKEIDSHPPFRSMIEHKAFLNAWLRKEYAVLSAVQHVTFMQERL